MARHPTHGPLERFQAPDNSLLAPPLPPLGINVPHQHLHSDFDTVPRHPQRLQLRDDLIMSDALAIVFQLGQSRHSQSWIASRSRSAVDAQMIVYACAPF